MAFSSMNSPILDNIIEFQKISELFAGWRFHELYTPMHYANYL